MLRYEAFTQRRASATLAVPPYLRRVQAAHHLALFKSERHTQSQITDAALFFGRLASRHLGTLVAAANRAAHVSAAAPAGRLTPPRQPLLRRHYEQAVPAAEAAAAAKADGSAARERAAHAEGAQAERAAKARAYQNPVAAAAAPPPYTFVTEIK